MSIRRAAFAAISTIAVLLAALVTSPAHAGANATVSGKVTSGAQGVHNALVTVYVLQEGSWVPEATSAYTDANGDYSLSLPAGTYRVSAMQFEPVYRTLYHPAAATVADAADVVVGAQDVPGINITFPPLGSLTGRVLYAGNPMQDAVVMAYLEDGTLGQQTTTAADGTFTLNLLDGTYLVRAGKKGYASHWAGGDSMETATRFTVIGGQAQPVGDIALTDRQSEWGAVAGQTFPFCTANKLPEQMPETGIDLPFTASFYGAPYSSAYINAFNGSVSFGEPIWGEGGMAIPDLTTPAVLPFMAGVNTQLPGSADVTYGSSPDGTTFCVLWDGVASWLGGDEKLNTFQLLLINRGSAPGRSVGDFDIVFNYDSITWDKTFSHMQLVGPTGASVGYTAGTGVPGTLLELDGSRTLGAFLNNGPEALIGSSANSAQPGRYIYEIRNGQDIKYGSAVGQVTDTTPGPVAGAWVSACLMDSTYCQFASTGSDGKFTFSALPIGDFRATVSPPGGSGLNSGYATFTVAANTQTTIPPVVLEGPQPLPPDTTITSHDTTDQGEPVVYWGEDLTLTTKGCAAGTATYQVLQGSTVVRNGSMTEGPAGTYTGTIAKLWPNHGGATIDIRITCPGGGGTENRTFDIYIDPSGKVVDQYGPVSGATATLLRSDTESGPYTVVPDGDPIMSPGNRTNPSLTTAEGLFGWDVIPGWYKVSATKAGCNTAQTPALPVPPPQLNLTITLACGAPQPSVAPTITGPANVGQTLTVNPGTWEAGIEVVQRQWLRDASDIPGATGQTYVVTDADAGKSLSVRLTMQRTGFAAFTTDTAAVKVDAAPTPAPTATVTPTPTPTVTPNPQPKAQSVSGKVPTKVKVRKSAALPKRTNAGQTVSWKTLTKKTCKVSKGKVKGVKKGKCRLSASAPQTAEWLALSQTYAVKVK